MLKEYTREDQSDFTPTKYDIVPLLLNGIVEKINQAKEAERAGCYAEKGFYLGRATGIVDALRNMLNTSDEISKDLDNIYNHLDLLMQASAEDKSSDYLDEALEIVESMSIFSDSELSMEMPLAANSGYSSEVRVS
ncbi:MAG: flagellar protein FliS [Gammaproteobacteria bacterium]|jgi:flagellar biosynthetic protein FliS